MKAKIVNTSNAGRAILSDIELTGAFLEDDEAVLGIALKMIDKAQSDFTFTLDGNILSGKEISSGTQFVFIIPAN